MQILSIMYSNWITAFFLIPIILEALSCVSCVRMESTIVNVGQSKELIEDEVASVEHGSRLRDNALTITSGLTDSIHQASKIPPKPSKHTLFRDAVKSKSKRGPVEKPLILTEYITAGRVAEARARARVPKFPGLTDVESYSGFLSVREHIENKIFFWFFPSLNSPETSPLAVWLQGGPGSSSLFGFFVEHGPYIVVKEMKSGLIFRDYAWCRNISMLYIDQPVGTGFSYAETPKGYAKTVVEASKDTLEALAQFFMIFPEYFQRPFFLMGESYAGKYIPSLAALIESEKGVVPRLSGVAIGNAYIDPITQSDHSDYLYHLGFIDRNQAKYMKQMASTAVSFATKNKYREAKHVMDLLIDGDVLPGKTFFENVTGLSQYYNYILYEEPRNFETFIEFLNEPHVKQALHVTNRTTFNDGDVVQQYMYDDLMTSQRNNFIKLLNNKELKVLLYTGQLDIIVPYVLTEKLMDSLEWSGRTEYLIAERKPWYMETGETVGYIKKVQNYMEILIRNAGHIVPNDQPHVAFEMISNFVFDRPFFTDRNTAAASVTEKRRRKN